MKKSALIFLIFCFGITYSQQTSGHLDSCSVEYPANPDESGLGNLSSVILAADFPVSPGQLTVETIKLYLAEEVESVEISFFTDNQNHPYNMYFEPVMVEPVSQIPFGVGYEITLDLTSYSPILDGGYEGAVFWLTVTTPSVSNYWMPTHSVQNGTTFFSNTDYYGYWENMSDFGLNLDGAFGIYGSCADSDAYVIETLSNPTEGGITEGSGNYSYGQPATVTAVPNEDYEFTHWAENGDYVSKEFVYDFIVNASRTLTANFIYLGDTSCETEYPLNVPGNGVGNMADVHVAADFYVEPGEMTLNILKLYTHFPIETFEILILDDNNRTPGNPVYSLNSVEPLYQFPWTQGPPDGDRQIVYLDLSSYDILLDGGDTGAYFWLALKTPGTENYWSSSTEIHHQTHFFTSPDEGESWFDTVNFGLDASFSIYKACNEMNISELYNSNEALLYPNPYENIITVKIENESIQNIQIYDLSGQLLIQKEGNKNSEMTVLEEVLPKGIYLLKVKTDHSEYTFRILKGN